jgi:ornithine carbamoyltransferase
MVPNLKGRHFLDIADFTQDELAYLIALAAQLKAEKRANAEQRRLVGKNIALIFEKLSTRTRCAFEVAAFDQGAHVTFLGATGSHMGEKETFKDTARVLGRMYDGIEYRGQSQVDVEEMAEFAGVPVWNGLTDESHPTQVLADLLTMQETSGLALNHITLCYLGDAKNNMSDSLLIGGAKMGMDVRMAAPRQFWPTEQKTQLARSFAQASGGKITVTESVEDAVLDCDFLYTDVWVSLGDPESAWADRIPLMLPYQVNAKTLLATKKSTTKFMHCLPAFHNGNTNVARRIKAEFGIDEMEVTDEVFESSQSVVFDQAENRMHSIKALMVATLTDG